MEQLPPLHTHGWARSLPSCSVESCRAEWPQALAPCTVLTISAQPPVLAPCREDRKISPSQSCFSSRSHHLREDCSVHAMSKRETQRSSWHPQPILLPPIFNLPPSPVKSATWKDSPGRPLFSISTSCTLTPPPQSSDVSSSKSTSDNARPRVPTSVHSAPPCPARAPQFLLTVLQLAQPPPDLGSWNPLCGLPPPIISIHHSTLLFNISPSEKPLLCSPTSHSSFQRLTHLTMFVVLC